MYDLEVRIEYLLDEVITLEGMIGESQTHDVSLYFCPERFDEDLAKFNSKLDSARRLYGFLSSSYIAEVEACFDAETT